MQDRAQAHRGRPSGVQAAENRRDLLRADDAGAAGRVARTPDISPAFILNSFGKPCAAASLGNLYREAARKAGIDARLHGLHNAFRVYWAEQGKTTRRIGAMASHVTLEEVERYTRAADRKQIVQLITKGGGWLGR